MNASQFRKQLTSKLQEHGDRPLLRIVLSPGADPIELTGRELLERSLALVDRYTANEPGSVVLLLLPHSLELFLLHFGLILREQLPAILPWPTSRIDAEKYQRNLLHQLEQLPAAALITLPQLATNMAPWLPFPVTSCAIEDHTRFERAFTSRLVVEGKEKPPAIAAAPRPADDAVFLQFSGGTTGAQKSVVVTAPMLLAQMANLQRALDFGENDRVVSWLPLYHDMGLIACLWFPLWHGAPSLHFSAGDWLLEPEVLFRYVEKYRATFCWLPNFAFAYLAAQRERMEGTFDVSSMRGWVNCSEPVRQRAMGAFAEAFAAWGVAAGSMQACYAMAETVFAVTQTVPGIPPATFPRAQVRERATAFEKLSYDVIDDVYVSSGRRIAGTEVRIVDTDGSICGEARPGQIQIRSQSLFSGYWGADGFVTNALSDDGWYSSGDYGFQAEGELYVIGRFKDIVIVGGQNIFPEDVELVVNTVPEIYPGRVVAFGVPEEQYQTESLAVVAELRGPYERARAQQLERQIQQLVLAAVGVAPRFVRVVPERWIVKSTAGKISRRDTRARFQQEMERPALAV